ncbi:MAG TPA: outer membrane protein assembly factor BamD [Prosthecobacter sp.]|nr:outer membrane protein assembly factor BamD [Prosthecobacter sp.]
MRAARHFFTSPVKAGLLCLLAAMGIHAQDQDARADETAALLLQRAQKALAAGDDRGALERCAVIQKKYPRTEWSAQALWHTAAIHQKHAEHNAAFEALDQLVNRQPGHFTRAHEEQLRLALRLLGLARGQRRSLEPVKKADMAPQEDIIAMLARVILNGPHSETGVQAHYWLGVALEKAGRIEEARAAYGDFVEKHPAHELADDAGYQAAEIAFKHWKEMRGAAPKDRERAAVLMTWFLARFPESEKTAQARASMAELRVAEERELSSLAAYYEARGDAKAAAIYYRELALKFPGLAMEGSPLRDKLASVITSKTPPNDARQTVGPEASEAAGK